MANPLLQEFKTPYSTAPFSSVKTTHFKPAVVALIKKTQEEIDEITENTDLPTFENTLEALEFSGLHLNRVTSIFFNLNSAETTDEIQQLAQEISPLLTEFANDIRLNEALFAKIKYLYDHCDKSTLNTEQHTLLEKNYKAFVRNGANLDQQNRKRLRELDAELSKLKLKFGEHVLAETNAFELHLTEESDLDGLPEGTREAAAMLAKQRKKKGWVFTLDYPSYVPFMTYASNRSLRKKMAKSFGARGFQGNENDNQQIVLDIVRLRHERSRLLGYKSHAHYVLEERMAETPDQVQTFLDELLIKAKPAAKKEYKMLTELAAKDGIEQLEKWDAAYYSEILKKQLFDLDQEVLKPYFSLDRVIKGVFEVSHKLFGLNFKEVDNIDTYNDEVLTYEVTDDEGNYMAILYADFFPRPGKRNGAWMTSFKGQWTKNGKNSRPHISIVCNFTKPTDTKPSLLTFNEVTTLFHEFGHALHGMLANTTYPNLSGTNVYWDFVELPSQLMENWCYEKEALHLFANHFETNDSIPMDLVEKIKKASNFLEGMQTLRQLSFGILDMHWHGKDPANIERVKNLEKMAFHETRLYPDHEDNCMSTAFSHIFQGGYSAGYYSYKWAEVLDADAFESFKENGLFDPATARLFKTEILEKGGTDKPMTLYKNFKGSAPSNKALLKRAGLI